MLQNVNIMAILPAKDLGRAQDFYRDKLGIESSESAGDGTLLFRGANGTSFLIYETENAGSAKNTQMGWESEDLDADMTTLRERGVVFEEYVFPGLKTDHGVVANERGKSAWFRDSEGNILNISQRA